MPPTDLQNYLCPYVTFDLLTPKVDHFMPYPMDHLRQLPSKSVSKYHVYKFVNG